jgi:histidinol dehydrogenase
MLEALESRDANKLKVYLESRSQDLSADVLASTAQIIEDVRKDKDEALKAYTQKFDGVKLDKIRLDKEALEKAAAGADAEFKDAMERAAANIRTFHEAQKQNGYLLTKELGIYMGQRVMPLDSVGIYVPGGRAQYPSSVLMNAIPAKVAGVKRIVMVTPPSKAGGINANIAFAALLAGVDEVYLVGGAQAVAALAYGTETIAPVDKIVGPGNIYVAAAKKLVFGKVDIDMIAGPSEILVIADGGADANFAAADLISQAEHDPMASAILLSDSQEKIDEVNAALQAQLKGRKRKEIIETSLAEYGKSILCKDLEECVQVANDIAPEHLELMVKDPMSWLGKVKHAGSVFLGYWTCESIGDYFGGTNHVLPTSGTARFSSALGVDSFIKKSSYLHYSKEALEAYGKYIEVMAKEEHLDGHAYASEVRRSK